MQRLFRACFLVCSLFCLAISTANTNGDKLGKSLQKECKKAVKTLKNEGWTVSGVSQSLEKAMENHFVILEQAGDNATVIEGRGKGNTVNVAVRRAMSNASSQYATMRGSEVEGRTEINVSNSSESENSTDTHTSLNASYVSSTSQTVKKFVPTVVLYRKVKDDLTEARAFYVVANDE